MQSARSWLVPYPASDGCSQWDQACCSRCSASSAFSSSTLVITLPLSLHRWQELIEPLEAVAEESGMPQHLQISEEDFRGSLSLLDGAVPGEETALAPLGDDGEDEEGGNGQWQ